MKMPGDCWLSLFLLLLVACTVQQERSIFPQNEWMVSSPEAQGVDSTAMQKALDHVKQFCGQDQLDEMVIVRNGYIIYQGANADSVHDLWSMTKSFTSTALGLLIEDGKTTLDFQCAGIEPLLNHHYPDVTLRHFTSMTSGYNAIGRSRWDGNSEDWSWTPFEPAEPLFSPGTEYCYWDEAMMMFGRVLTRIHGADLKTLLHQRIMQPIGIEKWKWWSLDLLETNLPIRNGCTGIRLSALQVARYGLLFLNQGNWNGTQLIPAEWVKQATRVQVPTDLILADTDRKVTDGRGCYGFNWWISGREGAAGMPDTPAGTYYASGFNHNLCFVIPAWNMVVVRMGQDGNPPEGKSNVWNQFFKRLALAIKE